MKKIKASGKTLLDIISNIGLLVIAISTVIAMMFEIVSMFNAMRVTLADLLLLFIYLEVLAMAGIYLKSGKLPVRMPLYIAIVAVARYMVIDMMNLDTVSVLGLSGVILILSLSVLAIRYGHSRYPYPEKEDG